MQSTLRQEISFFYKYNYRIQYNLHSIITGLWALANSPMRILNQIRRSSNSIHELETKKIKQNSARNRPALGLSVSLHPCHTKNTMVNVVGVSCHTPTPNKDGSKSQASVEFPDALRNIVLFLSKDHQINKVVRELQTYSCSLQ